MFPSTAYIGWSVNQASVHPPGMKPSTGVITDDPVPYVALIIPARTHPCPYIAACESASTATIGIPSRSPGTPAVAPNPAFDARTSGSADRGTPNASSSSSDQSSSRTSYSKVRDALPASVRCSRQPVSRWINQESTVPTRSAPVSVSNQ